MRSDMIEFEVHVPQIWNGHMLESCVVDICYYVTGWAWEYRAWASSVVYLFLRFLASGCFHWAFGRHRLDQRQPMSLSFWTSQDDSRKRQCMI